MSSILPKAMENNPRWKSIVKFNGLNEPCLTWKLNEQGYIRAPFTAKEYALADLDYDKTALCAEDNLCSACGSVFEDNDIYVFFDFGNGIDFNEEPPMHMACAGYTARVCPHITKGKYNIILADSIINCWKPPRRTMGETEGRFLFKPDDSQKITSVCYNDFLHITRPKIKTKRKKNNVRYE